MIRRCYTQQISAIAWRRAQEVLQLEFAKEKDALTASLSEHIEAGRDPEVFFAELAS